MEQSCPGCISHCAVDMVAEGEEGESAGFVLNQANLNQLSVASQL